jgi:hypothetical protein
MNEETVGSEGMVPAALKSWFVLHCIIDVIVALPLFVAPREVLGLLSWQAVDPFAARLTSAALFGIGLESWLGRNAGRESFRGMLQLKIIWSGFATVGLAWSVIEGGLRYPSIGWMLVGVFAAFHALWWYWRLRLENQIPPSPK